MKVTCCRLSSDYIPLRQSDVFQSSDNLGQSGLSTRRISPPLTSTGSVGAELLWTADYHALEDCLDIGDEVKS